MLLLVVAFLITILSFGGPLAAYAAPTPSASDTATPDAKKDDQAAAGDKTPADEKTATPAETPSETPSQKADDQETAQPSATPSKDQASEEPTSTPTPSESTDDPAAEPTTTETPTPTPSAKADKKAAAEDGGVTTQVVPPATGNNAVITVKVGGNRTTQTAIGNLAGVQLGFLRRLRPAARAVHLHLGLRRRLLDHRSQHPAVRRQS